MDFCMSCETDSVVFSKTKIKLGRESFETEAQQCENCGNVAISPQIQSEIDTWANQFTKSIIELQPYFSRAMYGRIIEYSAKFNLNKSEFMKACTVFYLEKMMAMKNFKKLRMQVLEKARLKDEGAREKICVSIKYQLFKKVELYSRVWKLEYDSNVMEEAVQFFVTILDRTAEVKEADRKDLIQFVTSHAMAS